MSILHSDVSDIDITMQYTHIYMTLFEQNCNCDNLKMAALGRNMQLFTLPINTIINPYYHSCVFMTDIYLTISLSTHNGDDTPQNCDCQGFNNLPPRSPDATPCNFFLCGYVKDQVYVPPLPASIPELKVRNQNRH